MKFVWTPGPGDREPERRGRDRRSYIAVWTASWILPAAASKLVKNSARRREVIVGFPTQGIVRRRKPISAKYRHVTNYDIPTVY